MVCKLQVGDKVKLTDLWYTRKYIGGIERLMEKMQARGFIYEVSQVGRLHSGIPFVMISGPDTEGILGYNWHPASFQIVYPKTVTEKDKSMFQAAKTEILNFIREHKGTLTLIAAVFLLDHFVFKGAFRERIKNIVENILKKIEDKIKV